MNISTMHERDGHPTVAQIMWERKHPSLAKISAAGHRIGYRSGQAAAVIWNSVKSQKGPFAAMVIWAVILFLCWISSK